MWVKLLGNAAFNPISAITRSTLAEITAHPEAGAIAKAMMAEADAVARALGIDVPVTIEQRFAGAARVGDHKTSMLQDLETGRPLELESIVGAIVELGDKLGVPVPHNPHGLRLREAASLQYEPILSNSGLGALPEGRPLRQPSGTLLAPVPNCDSHPTWIRRNDGL